MNWLIKILTIAFNIGIAMLLVVSLLLAASGSDKKNPTKVFGFGALVVLTGSMNPTFDAGSVIIIHKTDIDKLSVKDILTFRPVDDSEIFLTHRIIEVNKENGKNVSFVTQGDANNVRDTGLVKPEDIVGKTVFYINGLGTFYMFVRTPLGIGLLVILVFLKAFLSYYLNRKRGEEKNGENG